MSVEFDRNSRKRNAFYFIPYSPVPFLYKSVDEYRRQPKLFMFGKT